MKRVERSDILPLAAYEKARDEFRDSMIAEKARRRVHVGDRITLLFENRRTVIYQVQEMCHAEKITEPGKVQQELDTYNELLPREGELSATLFVEIPDQSIARAELDRLVGIDDHVCLVVGGDRIRAFFEPGYMTKERVSAVQYIRFKLDESQRRAFMEGEAPVRVAIDHPELEVEADIPSPVRQALCADLAAE